MQYIDKNEQYITIKHPDLPEFRMVKVDGGEVRIEETGKRVNVGTFYMAEFQVTQELYQAVVNASSSNFKGKKEASSFQGKRRPVERINWYESVEFCQELNKILELPQPIKGSDNKAKLNMKTPGFRLPTEAEWEYAAKGGYKNLLASVRLDSVSSKKLKYAGSNILSEVGWYDDNNEMETRAVGLKLPNQLGLYDMSGNVWEWCWDWYNNDKNRRVLRGGSWNYFAGDSRVAYRSNFTPVNRFDDFGLRLVLCF